MDHAELLELAKRAMRNARAPHSGFKVGAAVLCGSGKVYTGCNVESASYGLSICAERNAIFKAISEGEKAIRTVAIACSQPERCTPCGACRQVISELGDDPEVVTLTEKGPVARRITELLPDAFSF